MKKFAVALASAVFAMSVAGPSWLPARPSPCPGRSSEERWKTDEAVIKKIVEDNGDKYISADAQVSAAKQLTTSNP